MGDDVQGGFVVAENKKKQTKRGMPKLLARYTEEHAALDTEVAALCRRPGLGDSNMDLQAKKHRKSFLKDEIARLTAALQAPSEEGTTAERRQLTGSPESVAGFFQAA